MSKKQFLAALAGILLVGGACLKINTVRASDHDDGEMDMKGRSLNLTDFFVFREDEEVASGSANDMVFIMNTHPRSLPDQQYYYSTNGEYEFHIARVGTNNTVAANVNDTITIRFQFGTPNSNNQQAITMTTIRDGVTTVTSTDNSGNPLLTTNAYTAGTSPASTNSAVAAAPYIMNTTVNGSAFTLFVGHRADPFFFNVTGYFQMRLAAANSSAIGDYAHAVVDNLTPSAAGANPSTATNPPLAIGPDFTQNYNVSSIVLRLPISWLQTSANETVFDTWEIINVAQ